MLTKLVIIGRPNVGKSSLLNLLARRRVSIVDEMPGVTRDRVGAVIEWPDVDGGGSRAIELVDTGGHGIEDAENLTVQVERQIAAGVNEADFIIFVVDAQAGILPLDHQVARLLRTTGRAAAVLLVANKVDGLSQEPVGYEALQLGYGEPVMVSATTGYRKAELLEAISDLLDRREAAGIDDVSHVDSGVRLAIVGKRNAGKSTLVNALAGTERMIVSEVEGTTRDSVDVRFELDGHVVTAIDTAGMRKRKSIKQDVEYYGHHRALQSIRRADVVAMLIDASVPVSQVDAKLTREILRHHKPSLIVVNKWDLAEQDYTQQQYIDYLDKALKGIQFAPIAFVSAARSEGLREIVAMSLNLDRQAGHRVSTGQLNRIVERIIIERGPVSKSGRRPKVYYVTQLEVKPPTIGLFVNDPDLFDPSYERFLVNRLRDELPYSEVPIRLLIRGRHRMPAEARF